MTRVSWNEVSPETTPWALDGLGFLVRAPSRRAGEAGLLSGVPMRLASWWLGFGGRIGAFTSIMGCVFGREKDERTHCRYCQRQELDRLG